MTLSEMLRRYMFENDLTYEDFAKRCGLTKGYISMLVNNRNPKTGKPPVPKISTYAAIAEALGMSVDDLFRIIDDAPVKVSDDPPPIDTPDPKPRKFIMLSKGVLKLTDDQLDKVYQMAHLMYPDSFPLEDE